MIERMSYGISYVHIISTVKVIVATVVATKVVILVSATSAS